MAEPVRSAELAVVTELLRRPCSVPKGRPPKRSRVQADMQDALSRTSTRPHHYACPRRPARTTPAMELHPLADPQHPKQHPLRIRSWAPGITAIPAEPSVTAYPVKIYNLARQARTLNSVGFM